MGPPWCDWGDRGSAEVAAGAGAASDGGATVVADSAAEASAGSASVGSPSPRARPGAVGGRQTPRPAVVTAVRSPSGTLATATGTSLHAFKAPTRSPKASPAAPSASAPRSIRTGASRNRCGSWAILTRSCRSMSTRSVLRRRSTVSDAIVPLRSKAGRREPDDPALGPDEGSAAAGDEVITAHFEARRPAVKKTAEIAGEPDAGLTKWRSVDDDRAGGAASRPRRAVVRAQVAGLTLAGVDDTVATVGGRLAAGRTTPGAVGGHVHRAAQVAGLGRLNDAVAAVGAPGAGHGLAAVRGVVVGA